MIDGDKGKPAENVETAQHHIRFIQLNCLEAENLFLTDEVLGVMDTNWEEAKAKILAEAAAGTFGQKSAGLKAAAEGDRRRAETSRM